MVKHLCRQTPCLVCFPTLPVRMAVSNPGWRWVDNGEPVPESNGWPAVAVQDRLTSAWYLRVGPPTSPRQVRPMNGIGGWYSEEEALAEARDMGYAVVEGEADGRG